MQPGSCSRKNFRREKSTEFVSLPGSLFVVRLLLALQFRA